MTIATIVQTLGGIAQKQQLVARGARDIDLTRAVRSGDVIRARQGWYTTLPPHDSRVRAVRVGGRLTGLSAIAARGGWVLSDRVLHVSLPRNAARLRSPGSRFRRFTPGATTMLHWDDISLTERGTTSSVALADALFRVIIDEPLEEAIAALDWALHTGALDDFDFESLILSLPEPLRAIREWVDAKCESLPESLSRTRFRLAGHHVDIQVRLTTRERLDLVVDGSVGVDVDGFEWHANTFEQDRAKDLTATLERFHALRPSANAVFHDWERLQLAVWAALEERGIRLPSKIQEARSGRRRRVPRLRERHDSRAAEVLNFRRASRE
jgi:hypothetical protein